MEPKCRSDSVHRIRLGQVPDFWLLQDCLGTSVTGVNPVALYLFAICQVSVQPSGLTILLASFYSIPVRDYCFFSEGPLASADSYLAEIPS